MANHLTPEELSKEVGIERAEVIRICIEEAVPIYQGKIDKWLFAAAQRQAEDAYASDSPHCTSGRAVRRPRGVLGLRRPAQLLLQPGTTHAQLTGDLGDAPTSGVRRGDLLVVARGAARARH